MRKCYIVHVKKEIVFFHRIGGRGRRAAGLTVTDGQLNLPSIMGVRI